MRYYDCCVLLSELDVASSAHARQRLVESALRDAGLADGSSAAAVAAFMHCVCPDTCHERRYRHGATRLTDFLTRWWRLGREEAERLKCWPRTVGRFDAAVELVARRVFHGTAPSQSTVTDVDDVLAQLAGSSSTCATSGPRSAEDCLQYLYSGRCALEYRWITWSVLRMPMLERGTLLRWVGRVADVSGLGHSSVEIGRPLLAPVCIKARQMKAGVEVLAGEAFAADVKYDGERMEIHYDRKQERVQIFSKSLRDSTRDRVEIVPTLASFLRNNAFIKLNAVLEAELVAWDTERNCVAEFSCVAQHVRHMLRPHTALRAPNTELRAVLFDCVMLDGNSMLQDAWHHRRHILQQIHCNSPPHARVLLSQYRVFSPSAMDEFRTYFALMISMQHEGVVLKALTSRYGEDARWVKVKRDYIAGLGDTVDLLVVGMYHDARRAAERGTGAAYNGVYLACRGGPVVAGWPSGSDSGTGEKNAVDACLDAPVSDDRATLTVIASTSFGLSLPLVHALNSIQSRADCVTISPRCSTFALQHCSVQFVADAVPHATSFLFDAPVAQLPIADTLGSGFIACSARMYTLRFPRIVKCHTDGRPPVAVPTWDQLQRMARDALHRPQPGKEQAHTAQAWEARLLESEAGDSPRIPHGKEPIYVAFGLSQAAMARLCGAVGRRISNHGSWERLEKYVCAAIEQAFSMPVSVVVYSEPRKRTLTRHLIRLLTRVKSMYDTSMKAKRPRIALYDHRVRRDALQGNKYLVWRI